MQITPEIKAQLAEQKKECPFCKIVTKEIPSKIVFEDSHTLALLDIYPALKGHTLFLPKEHYPIMPYLPEEERIHFFGILPQLAKAVKSALVTVSVQIFIANGGLAGQQSAHFMIHLLPRDEGDGFLNFLLSKKKDNLSAEKSIPISRPFLTMVNSYFHSHPFSWHQGTGSTPSFLQEIKAENIIVYEDEKLLVILPQKCSVPGQIEIYTKTEEKYLENLSAEECTHLFHLASLAASSLFEGLKAQGTNILVKSGKTDDHKEGKLCWYILPRMPDDSLQGVLWERKQPKYDLDGVASKIKDKSWKVKYLPQKKEEVKVKTTPTENHSKPKTIQ